VKFFYTFDISILTYAKILHAREGHLRKMSESRVPDVNIVYDNVAMLLRCNFWMLFMGIFVRYFTPLFPIKLLPDYFYVHTQIELF
jgi:hypothetical protein